MIVTLTPNPSNDRTLQLDRRLARGEVMRASTATVEAGGKGVNVARVAAAADVPTIAVLPAADGDAYVGLLRSIDLAHRIVVIAGPVRTNITLAETGGTTTKINEPGPRLGDADVDALVAAVVEEASDAAWAVLSGSLPPGAPVDLYARVVDALREHDCRVAVDTSGEPLRATLETDRPMPDLVKPNADELAQVVGGDGGQYEADPGRAAAAASALLDRGVASVLLTLGAAGTVLVDRDGALFATPPQVEARSTVGAGDSALAGWVLADRRGAGREECLRSATAHGAAAVALPGSQLPRPDDLQLDAVVVEPLDPR